MAPKLQSVDEYEFQEVYPLERKLVQSDGWKGWVEAGAPEILQGPMQGWWPISGGLEVRRRGVAVTWRVEWGGQTVYVRHRWGLKGTDPRNRKPINALRWSRGGHRGGQAAAVAGRLAAGGFGVPRFLLVLRREAGAASEEILVTAALEAEPLAECIRNTAPQKRKKIVSAVGCEIARLHRAGWEHRELEPGNLLIGCAGRVYFIDLEQVRRRRLRTGWRIRNLAKLLARLRRAGCRRRELTELVGAYAAEWGGTDRSFAAALWRRVRRRAGELEKVKTAESLK